VVLSPVQLQPCRAGVNQCSDCSTFPPSGRLALGLTGVVVFARLSGGGCVKWLRGQVVTVCVVCVQCVVINNADAITSQLGVSLLAGGLVRWHLVTSRGRYCWHRGLACATSRLNQHPTHQDWCLAWGWRDQCVLFVVVCGYT
jgi:hypothetical protein